MHRPAGERGDNAFTQCVARENLSDANELALSLSERLFLVMVRARGEVDHSNHGGVV